MDLGWELQLQLTSDDEIGVLIGMASSASTQRVKHAIPLDVQVQMGIILPK